MKKIYLIAPFLLAASFAIPLFATAQEITCTPPCGQGYTCDSLQGVCVASQPTSGGSNTNTTSGFVPLAPIPGLTQGVTADQAGLANFFNNLYKYLIGLAAVLAVIEIIWGGLEISTKDSVSKQSDGKERIQQAIFGLVLVLSPVLVFSIINPSILNLSLNLPKLDTTSGPQVQTQQPSPCDNTTLTPEEKQACLVGQNARQQGVLNLTPAQQQAVTQAAPVIQQTATDQTTACTSAGGKVLCGSSIVSNGVCTPMAIREQSTNGSCTVLVNRCACVK